MWPGLLYSTDVLMIRFTTPSGVCSNNQPILLFPLFASCAIISILAMKHSIYFISIFHVPCFVEDAWWVQGLFRVLFIFGSLATIISPSTFVHATAIFFNSFHCYPCFHSFSLFIQFTTWQPENISLNYKLYCVVFLLNNYPKFPMSLRVYVSQYSYLLFLIMVFWVCENLLWDFCFINSWKSV